MIVRITIEKSWTMPVYNTKGKATKQTERYWNLVSAYEFKNPGTSLERVLESISSTVKNIIPTTNSVIDNEKNLTTKEGSSYATKKRFQHGQERKRN